MKISKKKGEERWREDQVTCMTTVEDTPLEKASPTRDDHQENRGDDYKYRKQDYNYSPKQGTSANRMDQPTPRGKSQEAYRDFSRGPSPKSPERSYRDASKSRLSGNGQLSNSSSSSLNYQQ